MPQVLTINPEKQLKKGLTDFSVGDIVRVHQLIRETTDAGKEKERTQVFEGLVLARKHGKGVNATFTIRKISSGIGVERVFPLHSPFIQKIEIVKKQPVRRSKLYYVRNRLGLAPRVRKSKTT